MSKARPHVSSIFVEEDATTDAHQPHHHTQHFKTPRDGFFPEHSITTPFMSTDSQPSTAYALMMHRPSSSAAQDPRNSFMRRLSLSLDDINVYAGCVPNIHIMNLKNIC